MVRRNRLGAGGAVVPMGRSNRGHRGNFRGNFRGSSNNFGRGRNDDITSGANAVEVRPACVFCGVGYHLLKDCTSFNNRIMPRCVWCNDPNHASFECSHKPKLSEN